MPLPLLSNTAARRLFLHKHALSGPPSGGAKGADLASLITDLGFVQVDSVNTLARAHDMILWSRRQTYRPEALNKLLHRDRAVFEHWTHDASVIPVAFFPHWRTRFNRDAERLGPRWRDWQGTDFEDRFDTVLKRISDHGEVTSGELADGEARGSKGWWDWHPSKTALEYLWRTGQVSVVRRDGFRKVYDLTERVIPADVLGRHHVHDETVNWACHEALDRLGFATSGEIAAFWALVTPDEAKLWCRAALASGEIIEIEVEDVTGERRRSFARPGIVEAAAEIALIEPSDRVRLLSPFDPALRDRNRAERLFGFYYRIEIFVPEPKRQYGYYVFPVLEGDRVIGRIDVKAQRAGSGKGDPAHNHLVVRAYWPERGVPLGKGRLARLQAELDRAARMGGCDGVVWAEGWLR